MKKFIAAAAGLALVGMASTAMAEVTFGGSARARAILKEAYTDGGSITKLDSRVRLKVNAKAKGGAFAKARIRMADGMWDGGQGATGNAADDKNIYVDYGYIGVPMGPVVVSAGRQIAAFSKWFAWDGRKDRIKAVYKNAGTTVALFYDKNAELTDEGNTTATWPVTFTGGVMGTASATTTITGYQSNDWTSDNDMNGYGIVVAQKFGDWKAKAIFVYGQDETPASNNSIVGSLNVTGKAGPVSLAAEVSFKDFENANDTQMGGYVQAGTQFGAVSAAVIAGATMDGFMADNDFGTHMIGNGNNSPIAFAQQIGNPGGDAYFGVLALGFSPAANLALNAYLTYAALDNYANLIEISGGGVYTISDGAALTFAAGAVIPSDEGGLNGYDDTAIGAYMKLEVKY